MQRLGHCVLLLVIVLLPNKSKENAPGTLNYPNNNEQYNNTHFTNSPRNRSVQILRETFRENSSRNNPRKETRSISTDREELHEKEEFVQRRRVTKIKEDQARANKKAIEIFLTPIKNKNGIYFKAERNNTTKIKQINFCCPLGYRLSLEHLRCFVNHDFIFPFAQNMSNETYYFRNIYIFPTMFRKCPSGFKFSIIDPKTLYMFLDDGTVQFPHNNFLPPHDYCLAAVNRTEFDLILCRQTNFDSDVTYIFVGIIVTLIFLLITFVVYSVLPEFRNMHGYTLRAYIASLFVSHAMFALYSQVKLLKTLTICVFFSFIFTSAIYSSFLWLNVMCFDIWWTLRSLRPVHDKTERKRKIRKTFVIYTLYVWGVSIVAAILFIIMDFTPIMPEYFVKPQICKLGIWFATEKAKIIYFYIPIGITLICNICLFVWTALKMLRDKKRINRQMKGSESCRHDSNKKRLWVYLKLFIIMGINWIPINLTVKFGSVMYDDVSYHAWFYASLLTPLQGVIIFIIFVCKKKVIQLLMKRFK